MVHSSSCVLCGVSAGLIVLCLLLFLAGIVELGFHVGLKRVAHSKEYTSDVIQQGLLTLLSLLLAFGVSMAETRFEERNSILIEEANAIGTSYLRAELFPRPIQKSLQTNLKQYLDLRILFYQSESDTSQLHKILEQTALVQAEFWNEGTRLGRTDPNVTKSLLLTSLNLTIDLQAKQGFAFERQMPRSIGLLLLLTSALVVGLVGFGHGIRGIRHKVFTSMLCLVVALTLFVIFDLDRARGGWIRLNPTALIQLRRSMGA